MNTAIYKSSYDDTSVSDEYDYQEEIKNLFFKRGEKNPYFEQNDFKLDK